MLLKPQRRGFHSLTPRIVLADVSGLVGFLRAVFGATGELVEGRPVEMRIGDSTVMISADGERAGFAAFLYVYVDSADETYRLAVDNGATSIEEAVDTPYGDRRAMVRDPFGNVWQIAHVLSDGAPASLAREGDVDALFTMGAGDARAAYKWLSAALDFGHEEADDLIGDLLETSSLRFDDSRFEVAAAEWELGCAWLEGSEGLPRDLALAKKHLELALEEHTSLESINAGAGTSYSADAILARLPDDARLVLERALAGDDFGRAIRHLERLRRLVEVGAPTVIADSERRALRGIMATLCPAPVDPETMGTDPLRDEIALVEAGLARMRAELERRG